MRKNKNIWFLIVGIAAAVCLAVAVFFVVQQVQGTQLTFSQDGYVLKETNSDKQTGSAKAQPLYFKAGASYASKYPKSVVFSDVQSNQIVVDEASFLHFADGSMTALSSGVVLSLGDLDDETMIRCYGLKAGTVMQSSADGYMLDHMGTPITYERLIWKLDTEKYLVAGNSFELRIPNQEAVPISGYVEIEYVDNGIVTIFNNNMMIRTIASDCELVFDDGVVINLSDRTVLSGDDVKMGFAQMVIDSDENINVMPLDQRDKNAVIPKFITVDGKNGENGKSGDGGKAGEAGGAGALGDSVGAGNPEPTTEPEKRVILPVFDVNIDQSALTASTVKGSVKITDAESRIVPGTVTMKILNNATGETAFGPQVYDGFVFDFEATGLKEDTEYRLIFEAQYTVNDEQFSKIFYDGVFVADAIGLSLDIDSVKIDALSFKVKKEAFSPVSSAVLELYDANGSLLDQKPLSFLTNTETVTFDSGLTPDTGYSVQLAQVGGSYSNGTPVQYDKYGAPKLCRTLKRTPTVGAPNVTVNKRNGTFELQIRALSDPDNGVQKIRYEIYEAGGTVPVSTAYGMGTNRVDFEVNGYIQRNVGYTAKAVAEFSDNEKTIDVESDMSSPFIMEGANFPTLMFEQDGVDGIKFDRIKGTLTIKNSDDNAATVDTGSNIIVHWQDSVGNVYSKTVNTARVSGGDVVIDFDQNGLRQKETYTIWVTAKVDLNDANPVDEVVIGPVKVQTIEAGTFAVSMSKTPAASADPSKAISIDVTLDDFMSKSASYEASTLGSLVFNLYEGSTKDKSKLLSSLPINVTGGSTYASPLKAEFYDGTKTLTEADFGLNAASLNSSTYLIELESAHDYTDHNSNYFNLQNNTFAFIKTSTPPLDPPVDQRGNQFDITPITKATAGGYKVNLSDWLSASAIAALNNNTVIGYEVTPKFNNSGKYARLVTYQIHKLTAYQDTPLLDNATAVAATTTITPGGINVPVEASQDYLPHLVVFFGPQGTAQPGFVGSDKTRYYYFTGYEQQTAGGGFGRGAQYFFSYKAKLNTIDSTASYNTDYPTNPADPALLLYSTAVSPQLQAPTFAFYPSTSGNTSVSWKYQYADLDNVLQTPSATLYCRRADSSTAINNQTITKTTTNFNTVTFTGFSSSIPSYELYVQQNLLPAYAFGTTGQTRALLSRAFETDNLVAMNYSVYVPDDNKNRLFVVLGKDATHMGEIDDAVYRRIAGAEVTATYLTTTKVMNLGVIRANVNGTSQTCIEVPYTLLSNFRQGDPITFSVRVFYDTGQSGFDTGANYYAVQFPASGAPAPGDYRVIRSIGSGYTDAPNASGSWYHTVTHNQASRTISYGGNMMAGDPNATGSYSLTYAEGGATAVVAGSQRQMTLKALKAVTAASTGTVTVSMPVAIPEVTIDLDADVSVGIDSISGQFKLTGLNVVTPPDFYIEFYNDRMQLLDTLTLPISVTSGTNNIFSFSRTGGLSPATVYYFRIAGYINGKMVTFYDTAAMQPKFYQFRTLGEVHIQNVSVTYGPVTYADKSLYANFTLDTTMGFRLAYDFVRTSDGDVLTDEELPGIIGTVDNARSMRVPIDIDPTSAGGDWFRFGGRYTLRITAYSGTKPTYNERLTNTVDPAHTETRLLGQTVQSFDLDSLNEPIMGLSATASDDGGVPKLSVRIAPGDWDRTIVDDLYLFRIYNSNGVDVTPAAEAGAKSATAAPRTVEVTGLAVGSEYTIRCYGVTDLENTGVLDSITEVASPTTLPYLISEIRAYTLDSSGISVGTVTPRKSPTNPSYVQLTFTNSVKLADLTELRYTIYKDGQAVDSLKKISFANLHFDAVNNYYYIDLETVLPGAGSYTIQVQYYKGALKVGADATYSYIYS